MYEVDLSVLACLYGERKCTVGMYKVGFVYIYAVSVHVHRYSANTDLG